MYTHNMAPIVQQPSEVRFPELNRSVKMDIRINLTAEELIKIKSISWPLGVTDVFVFDPRQIELPVREQSLLAHRSIVHISVS